MTDQPPCVLSRCLRYEDYAAARSDGRADLVCHFDNRAVAQALEASMRRPLAKGELLTLHLTGNLSDPEGDIPVVGSAGILIVGQQSRRK